jgi:hypothetical protein
VHEEANLETKLIGDRYVPRAFIPHAAAVVEVSDDGRMLIRYEDGGLESIEIPIERVPECRKLIARPWTRPD